MYEELVKSLKTCGTLLQPYTNDCVSNHDGCCEAEPVCMYELMRKAADAIEYINGHAKILEKVADYWCKRVPKWIPVTERLPDLELVEVRAEDMDLFACLVVKTNPIYPKKRYITKAWYDGEGFMDTDCIWITKSVTHWMPLPEPPKEVE